MKPAQFFIGLMLCALFAPAPARAITYTKNYKAALVPAFTPCTPGPCGTTPQSDWTFEKGVVQVEEDGSTNVLVQIKLSGVRDDVGDRCNENDELTFRVIVDRVNALDSTPTHAEYTMTTTPSCEAYPNDGDVNAGMSISVGLWDFVEIRAIELEDTSGNVLAVPGITINTVHPYP